MQTILGAGGAIGIPLAKELSARTDKVRLVGRNPQKINPEDELFPADLKVPKEVLEAVKGSEVAYLTVGLQYSTEIWQKEWPLIMENVIRACSECHSKLVFLDNVYMYGRVEGWMTEETPFNPQSLKGEIRAGIAERLTRAYKNGEIEAAILRAADFYGPDNKGSVLNMLVLDKLKEAKKANWLVNAEKLHTYTYTPDAAKAMAMIGNNPSAYNQTWHAPSDRNVLTGKGYINLTAEILNVKPEFMVFKKWQLRMAGLFDPIIRESYEMLYQNEYDYLFDSTKFESFFNFKPTLYKDGIMGYLRG
ncbi:MAG TPA: NAD-dependent epimerase/dehydratase family protein [Ignavibacteriales bacterium]|nr:NAD-dependent epimerase/dehydratase family protein [Ignavibacteriales bacterium]